ncbi:GGDEF domain-containing phosphodiesterase [Vibrio sp. SS-MA-C1-2]|uniref:EAL domain-containing protein n=1 Tax=Vibrio sp. SS-MA-C1-2 TaxID=2908646 RepID=UPI001F25F0A4|nr:GGDEF domain-containing phosphodiesterase [Vibrio sp. SS-MA-C1-2]UJF17718.1 GGDEF domain-containing phosphodiesterase [Vibrio sp. SS-MA-C1-2]
MRTEVIYFDKAVSSEFEYVRRGQLGGQFAVIFLSAQSLENPTQSNYCQNMLVNVERLITSCIRRDTLLSYVGHRQFALLLRVEDKNEVLFVLRRLMDVFSSPIVSANRDIFIHLSAGVSFSTDSNHSEEMIKKAQTALSSALKSGSHYQYENEKDNQLYHYRYSLIQALPNALKNGEITAAFQRINDIDSPRFPMKVEALFRWNSPKFGSVSPLDIIPLIESETLLDDVMSEIVLQCGAFKKACKLSSQLEVNFSINISPYQMCRYDFLDKLTRWLNAANLTKSNVTIEVTENNNTNHFNEVFQAIERLNQAGFIVSLDDFGAGDTTIKQLLHFNLGYIKIDMSLLRLARESVTGCKIYMNLVELCQLIGAEVITEGVEDDVDLNIVKQSGTTYWQGYYSSKPMEMNAFIQTFIQNKA